ncbi:Outer membrane protein TolC [bacterium HR17]|uniref:Outer membrane protein TolC n=1 Tax=Candidatus Fervidibacter japonicus TaxID=2035412 RepID=A0A2H5XFB8_9BACT|nr:Outer membrane protein TolC [bacterium HR17]
MRSRRSLKPPCNGQNDAAGARRTLSLRRKTTQLLLLAPLVLSQSVWAQRMTLKECIAQALQTHPQVKLAQSQLDAATARLRQAKAQLRPELTFTGTHRQQGPTVSFFVPQPPPLPPREVTVVRDQVRNLNLELQQNIYDGGRFTATIRGASHLVNAADEGVRSVQAQLILRVTQAYADVLASQAFEEVARQSVERVQAVLKVAQARFEAGTAPKFDVLRAEAELATAQEQLLSAQNAVALAKAALNQLLGRPTDAPVELEPLPEPLMAEPTALRSEPFLRQALANRPELRSAEWQIKAAQERVNFAKADKNLLAFLTGNYQRQTATGFSRDYAWGINLIVQLPIFDSGRRESVLQEQEALLRQASAQREQLERQIALEVEEAVRNYQIALQRLNTARAALKSAEEAYRLAQVRYEAGAGTQVEVLDAQVALTSARANEVRALYDAHKAFAQLVYATGLSDAEVRRMLVALGRSDGNALTQATNMPNRTKGGEGR